MSQQYLFRKEVQKSISNRLNGNVFISSGLSYYVITSLLFCVVFSLVVFSIFGHYTPRTKALGELIPVRGLTKVYPNKRGVIVEILVKEGQDVSKGDSLVKLSYDKNIATGKTYGYELENKIKHNLTSLDELINSEKQKQSLYIKVLNNNKEKKRLEKKNIVNNINNIKKSLSSREMELASIVKLRKQGYISDQSVSDKQIEVDRLTTELKNLEISKASNHFDESMIEIEAGIKIKESKEKLENLYIQRTDLNKKLLETISLSSEIINAPMDGKVTTLLASIGRVADINRPLLTLLPLDSKLEAELYVASDSIGTVYQGQEVALKLRAFPSQKYGTFSGSISSISNYTIQPDELPLTLGFRRPVYRLKIALEKQTVNTKEKILPLLPGMLAEANLLGERLSIMEWILEPVLRVKDRFE